MESERLVVGRKMDDTNEQAQKKPVRRVGRPRKTPVESEATSSENEESLTERQRELLRLVIQEFVSTAAPVSSEGIVAHYGLPYSSATVRNELVELERQGYITQPHTSAGRIPSDRGYRYYVERLMAKPSSLSSMEQHNIQHQFYQLQLELSEWLRMAASVTARTSHNAALVTTPRTYDSRLKYLQLLSVQEKQAVLVLVSQDGTFREQMVNLEMPQVQDDLNRVSNRLNTLLSNLNWKKIEERIADWPEDLNRQVAHRVADLLKVLDQSQAAQIYRDGLVNILKQPEFSDIERVRQVVQVIEEGQALTNIIPEVLSNEGQAIQVFIGGDNRFDDLRLLSVVMARYGIDGQVAGVVGIVGPTRMEYGRSISTVQYISHLLSGLMNDRRG